MSVHTIEDHSFTAWSHAPYRPRRSPLPARLRAWLFSPPAEGYVWERKR